MRAIWSAIVLVSLIGCSSNAERPKESVEVTVADLLNEPKKYSGKHIVVSGYWVRGFEWSFLTDDPHTNRGSPIWMEAWVLPEERKVDWKAISAAVAKAYRAVGQSEIPPSSILWVRCSGWFEHREFPTSGEPNQRLLGFGHLDAYSSRLTIEKILDVRVVPELPLKEN